MHRLLISVVFLFTQLTVYAQEDTTSVAFVSYWSLGDTYEFAVTKIKKRWNEGVVESNDSVTYKVKFEVIDSTATSYKIRWRFKNHILNNYEIPEDKQEGFSKYELLEIIYTTSEMGAFVGVENWEEIGATLNRMFSDLADVLSTDPDNKLSVWKTLSLVAEVYSSKQGIEQLLVKELQYFHFPFGVSFSTTSPLIYEDKLPNMFGGKPIRADCQLFFESVNREKQTCVFVNQMQLNEDDTKKIVMEVFKKMGLKSKETKKFLKEAVFEINDFNRFEYQYYPGVPIKITTDRTVLLNLGPTKTKNSERIIIELIK